LWEGGGPVEKEVGTGGASIKRDGTPDESGKTQAM